jgi:glycine/D-amino acid oxidase-like deaminating enzyme
MPGATGYYLVVTHSGVTLSAVLAQLVANELVRGVTEQQLEPFRPARLIG